WVAESISLGVLEIVAIVDRLARTLVRDLLAVLALDLAVLRLADVEDVVLAGSAVDEPVAEPDADRVLAGATMDVVVAMAGVHPVVTGAGEDGVVLVRGVAGRLVVAPDHIVAGTAVQPVVAVAAE